MSDIAAQMLTEALAAQKFTRKFFVVELDFSESSLHELERQFEAVKYALRGGYSPENITKLTGLWGAYLGEVLRRQCDLQWEAVVIPEGEPVSMPIVVGGVPVTPVLRHSDQLSNHLSDQLLRPHHRVQLRLEQGVSHNIVSYFEETKAAIGPRGS
ncbi:MAG: hypothetical protein ACKOBW_08725 [Planctomycetota bacterium]